LGHRHAKLTAHHTCVKSAGLRGSGDSPEAARSKELKAADFENRPEPAQKPTDARTRAIRHTDIYSVWKIR